MSDHKYIFLQPECCADPACGRLWCKDSDPEDCDDGVPWTAYILLSEYEPLRQRLKEVEADNIKRKDIIETLVELYFLYIDEFDESGDEYCDKFESLLPKVCDAIGHADFVSDQCGIPDHDYCIRCRTTKEQLKAKKKTIGRLYGCC